MEETITSRRNPLLAHTKKLLTSRSYREKMGEFAADGVKLLAEAARWYPGLTTVIAEDGIELCKLPEQTRVVRVPKDVMQSISLMDAPQGAIFLCRLPEAAPAALTPGTLLLDGIQDPGNLGTILRTADALQIPAVLLDGCAECYGVEILAQNSRPVVRDADEDVRAARADLQVDPAAVGRVFDGVRDDIRDDLLDALAVAVDVRDRAVTGEGHGMVVVLLGVELCRVIHILHGF